MGTTYYNELNKDKYLTNRNVKLDMNNILHLKDRFVTKNNTGTDFNLFENQFVTAISDQDSNVNVSMKMMDENQFSLKDSPKDPRIFRSK